MKIRVAGVEITKWQNLSLSVIFDSIKSTFSVDIYWNPFDKSMRLVMLPGGYNQVTIVSDNGQVLFTGVFINPSFKSNSTANLVNLSGYSLTGVLDDVTYSAIVGTTQTSSMTFAQICQTVCDNLGLRLVDNTNGKSNVVIANIPVAQAESDVTKTDADYTQSAADYLSEIAKELDIVLSHDVFGNLVLNYQIGTSDPVYNFTQGMPGVEYTLSVDGSQLHSTITAASQSDHLGTISDTKSVTNPFVAPQGGFNYRTAAMNEPNNVNIAGLGLVKKSPTQPGQLRIMREYNTGYRPTTIMQQATDPPNLQDVANQALADELTAIVLTVKVNRWELNSKIVPVASVISVQNPELYLFNKANFFIRQIDYSGDSAESMATYICTVPEAYNGAVPTKSIFFGTNYTNFVDESNPPMRSDDRRGINNNLATPPNL